MAVGTFVCDHLDGVLRGCPQVVGDTSAAQATSACSHEQLCMHSIDFLKDEQFSMC
jgi:hypothetical protein